MEGGRELKMKTRYEWTKGAQCSRWDMKVAAWQGWCVSLQLILRQSLSLTLSLIPVNLSACCSFLIHWFLLACSDHRLPLILSVHPQVHVWCHSLHQVQINQQVNSFCLTLRPPHWILTYHNENGRYMSCIAIAVGCGGWKCQGE